MVPGETVLAFYTAENPTDKRISGISTYNVTPFEAAQYFNKIQCFCFDEQQLNAHEQVCKFFIRINKFIIFHLPHTRFFIKRLVSIPKSILNKK